MATRSSGNPRSQSSRSPRQSRRLLRIGASLLAVLIVGVARSGIGRDHDTLPATAVVRRVVDGDTVELADGRLVRYIGMDTPEVRYRVYGQWVRDPEPFAEAATDANRRWVEGKTVRLEYDVQSHDRYGRLLAYVYVPSGGDEVMVNAELVHAGFAHPLTIPPNVRYVERFRALAAEARGARRGLWSGRGR